MKIYWKGDVREIKTVWLDENKVKMIDQRFLPGELRFFEAESIADIAKAIEEMIIRGAPAIGAVAAYGLALAQIHGDDIEKSYFRLKKTRPTGHDLFHALDLMMESWRSGDDLVKASRDYALRLEENCLSIGHHGEKLLKNGSKILTHCNAGALATVDYGTATAPIRIAHSHGKKLLVYVSETRPRLQGSRLTAWEFAQEGIEHIVIVDSAAAMLMKKGEVDIVLVGADRIAVNGDTANKIGTYDKAIAAKENGIPFYVATPMSTLDFSIKTGKDIQIEERSIQEIARIGEIILTPEKSKVFNPAFDVTPAKYITGFITEKGVFSPKELKKLSEH